MNGDHFPRKHARSSGVPADIEAIEINHTLDRRGLAAPARGLATPVLKGYS